MNVYPAKSLARRTLDKMGIMILQTLLQVVAGRRLSRWSLNTQRFSVVQSEWRGHSSLSNVGQQPTWSMR